MKTFKFSLVWISLIASLTFGSKGFAHLSAGVYEGKLLQGAVCRFEILEVGFEGNIHHPLNERVKIHADGFDFTLAHLPKVNLEAGTVEPEHEILTAAFATKEQSVAGVLKMSHVGGHPGPKMMTVLKKVETDEDHAPELWQCGDLMKVSR